MSIVTAAHHTLLHSSSKYSIRGIVVQFPLIPLKIFYYVSQNFEINIIGTRKIIEIYMHSRLLHILWAGLYHEPQ